MAKLDPRARAIVVRSGSGFIEPDKILSYEILVVNYTNHPEIWDLPGGHIDSNEKPEHTVIREVREETGITCNIIRKLIAFEKYRMLKTGVRLHYDVHVFLCYGDGTPSPHDTEEIKQAVWMPFKEAMQYVSDVELRTYILKSFQK